MQKQRVTKLLSQKGVCSRREAEEFIRRGLVFVQGEKVLELGTKAMPTDEIALAPQALRELSAKISIMLHKPLGYVSSPEETGHKRAIKLIQAENQFDKGNYKNLLHLAPVGRLDINSSGLLLFTQDGVLARDIIGPEAEVEKEYLVGTSRELTKYEIDLMSKGMQLDEYMLRPVQVSKLSDGFYKLILVEGKKRQIRRMLESFSDMKVQKLKRVRIGNLRLGDLPLGKWRLVEKSEILP